MKNPYLTSIHEGSEVSPRRTASVRGLWLLGVVLPAIAFNVAAVAEDQAIYAASPRLQIIASNIVPCTSTIFYVSILVSIVIIGRTAVLRDGSFATKVGVAVLSFLISGILLLAGVVVSMFLTGLPV